MIPTAEESKELQLSVITMLHTLRLSVHRLGYKYLTVAIAYYALDDTRSLTKEVYPYVAKVFGCADWHSVERSIRAVIVDAWGRRDEAVWAQYFPDGRKPPSNKVFIAALAELLQQKKTA